MRLSTKLLVTLVFVVFIAVLAGIAVICSTSSAALADKCFEDLPYGCFVIGSIVVPQDQTADIGKKLGASIKRLSNTDLQVHGAPIKVNIFDAATDADAAKLYTAVSAMKGHPAFCLRIEKKVIEYVASNPARHEDLLRTWLSQEAQADSLSHYGLPCNNRQSRLHVIQQIV